MTVAMLSQFLIMKVGNAASPEVFTSIGEVVSFGSFGQMNDLIDVTHLESLAKEYIYGLADGVELPVVCNYIPTGVQQVAMLAAQAAKTTKNFKLALPTSPVTSFTFSALVRGWSITGATNTAIQITFTMKISGQITGPA